MVDTEGEMVEYELNSPFVYLRSVVDDLFTFRNGEGGSEQIHEGASISQKPPVDNVKRFLFILGFDAGNGRYLFSVHRDVRSFSLIFTLFPYERK